MRILIVGAGATGGYFGARLLQHGRDVTFLVRAGRAGQLAEHGLVVRSDAGNVDLPPPSTVLSQDLRDPFDLIVLGCKAYALEQALIDIAPAVGPHSTILPLLNGMRHLDRLDEKFGAQRALGGQCVISATLDDDGVVRHLNRMHSITFGERDGESSVRMGDITRELSDAGFDARPSERIVQEMWDKWFFLTTLAGITCLMRGSVGDIASTPHGSAAALALLEECRSTAAGSGYAPAERVVERARALVTEPGSALEASMLRDLRQGHLIEADHVVGDMLDRARRLRLPSPMLELAHAHLKVYEARRHAGAA